MMIQKKHLVIYALSLLLAISCSTLELPEDEALRLLNEANNFPKPVSTIFRDIRADTPLYREIERLTDEGYLKGPKKDKDEERRIRPKLVGTDEKRTITVKGKKLIEFIDYNVLPMRYTFAPFTHERKIKEITDISVDNDKKVAVVEYEVGYFPTEYFIHLKTVDPKRTKAVENKFEVYKMQSKLKKNDQGWQVIENSILPPGS